MKLIIITSLILIVPTIIYLRKLWMKLNENLKFYIKIKDIKQKIENFVVAPCIEYTNIQYVSSVLINQIHYIDDILAGGIREKLKSKKLYNIIEKKFENFLKEYNIILRVNNILSKKDQSLKEICNKFNEAKKELKEVKEKYSDILIDKYLKNFNTDKNYYTNNFYNVMEDYLCRADVALKENKFDTVLKNIKKFEDLKGIYLFEINAVFDLRKMLSEAENNIKRYEDDIKNTNGSLYSKIYKKMKNNKTDEDIINKWNSVKRKINNYMKQKISDSDVVSLSSSLITIITDLNKIDLLASSNIEKYEEQNTF